MINNPSQVISSSWFIWIWFSQSVSISCRLTDGPVSERDVMTVRDIRDRYSAAHGANRSLGSDFCTVCQLLKGHDSVETGSGRFRHYCFLSLESWAGLVYIRTSYCDSKQQPRSLFIYSDGTIRWNRKSIIEIVTAIIGALETGKCGVSMTANEEQESEGNPMSSLCVIRGLTKQPMTSKQW